MPVYITEKNNCVWTHQGRCADLTILLVWTMLIMFLRWLWTYVFFRGGHRHLLVSVPFPSFLQQLAQQFHWWHVQYFSLILKKDLVPQKVYCKQSSKLDPQSLFVRPTSGHYSYEQLTLCNPYHFFNRSVPGFLPCERPYTNILLQEKITS